MKSLLLSCALIAALAAHGAEEWKLDFEEEFDGPDLDSSVWLRTSRGKADWNNTQSDDPRLVELRDGCLVLKGMVNDRPDIDSATYITGGIVSRGLREFGPGRFEVRARLNAAQGAWPAIWLLPSPRLNGPWPQGGEIDMMERLNHDGFVYQTVHSSYTLGGHDSEPPHFTTAPIDTAGFNTYAVEIDSTELRFFVNGSPTFTYPRLDPEPEGQYPFVTDWYFLIDMQLGGSWVGEVDPRDLPVEMEIDRVRHYSR